MIRKFLEYMIFSEQTKVIKELLTSCDDMWDFNSGCLKNKKINLQLYAGNSLGAPPGSLEYSPGTLEKMLMRKYVDQCKAQCMLRDLENNKAQCMLRDLRRIWGKNK